MDVLSVYAYKQVCIYEYTYAVADLGSVAWGGEESFTGAPWCSKIYSFSSPIW